MGTGSGRRGGAPRRIGEDVAPWVATAAVCTVGVALAAPEWVPTRWSREDGPIEYATFAAFLVASALALRASVWLRPTRRHALAAAALGLVLFVAAGEEISWGQRLLELETPGFLVDGNRQDELNLHNVDGLQDKAVLAQLGIASGGILLAVRSRRSWARAGLPFFAAYLAYRAGRAASAVVGWGAADRNSEAAELVLALGLVALTAALAVDLRRARARVPRAIDADRPRVGPPEAPRRRLLGPVDPAR